MAIFINQSHRDSTGSVHTITISGEHKDIAAATAHLGELEVIFGVNDHDTFTFVNERLV